jgi:hypothetical protein
MQQFAAAFGTFIGYAIGHILKIAGPELRVFLSGVIRDALKDTAERGSDSGPLAGDWDNGLHRRNETRGNSERGERAGFGEGASD